MAFPLNQTYQPNHKTGPEDHKHRYLLDLSNILLGVGVCGDLFLLL